tara:strand:+ start:803 stop:1186 length:384 start_codon:yes stop_codon:yes gene_type:complete
MEFKHPDILHIGFKSYKIVQKDLSDEDGVELYGYVDLTTNVIYLDPSQESIDYKGTMLHEILHVGFNLFGLGDDDEMPGIRNEFLTTITSNMMQMLVTLNPELFEFIFSRETPPESVENVYNIKSNE